jgi:hypothetical protein
MIARKPGSTYRGASIVGSAARRIDKHAAF